MIQLSVRGSMHDEIRHQWIAREIYMVITLKSNNPSSSVDAISVNVYFTTLKCRLYFTRLITGSSLRMKNTNTLQRIRTMVN